MGNIWQKAVELDSQEVTLSTDPVDTRKGPCRKTKRIQIFAKLSEF